MSNFFWNVRGLNNDTRQSDLYNIQAKYKSSISAKPESKFSEENIDMFKCQLADHQNLVQNSSDSAKGRIMILQEENTWSCYVLNMG